MYRFKVLTALRLQTVLIYAILCYDYGRNSSYAMLCYVYSCERFQTKLCYVIVYESFKSQQETVLCLYNTIFKVYDSNLCFND